MQEVPKVATKESVTGDYWDLLLVARWVRPMAPFRVESSAWRWAMHWVGIAAFPMALDLAASTAEHWAMLMASYLAVPLELHLGQRWATLKVFPMALNLVQHFCLATPSDLVTEWSRAVR